MVLYHTPVHERSDCHHCTETELVRAMIPVSAVWGIVGRLHAHGLRVTMWCDGRMTAQMGRYDLVSRCKCTGVHAEQLSTEVLKSICSLINDFSAAMQRL